MDGQKIPAFPVTLFYAYAHMDEKLRQKLERHLSILRHEGIINAWYDRQIVAGTNWKQAIDDHLDTASLILLLISPDFVASDYCYGIEMQQALARHEEGSAYVIPILLRPIDWENAPFSSLQVLPSNAKPVTSWRNQDAAFADITKGIRRVLEDFSSTYSSMSSPLQYGLASPSPHQKQFWNASQGSVMIRLKYLKHIEGRYAFTTFPLGPVEGLSLRVIFQPLALRRDPVTAEDRQLEERRRLLGEATHIEVENEPHVMAHNGEEAVAKSPRNRIIVLGGPGTGKTTLLQSLVSERTRQALVDLAALLPIFLSLPDVARSGKTLPEYLGWLMMEVGISWRFSDLLWRTIEEGRAFVCLDSLDEVTPRERPKIIRLINELAARPGNIWVVGSRFTEYKGGQFKRGEFAEWELLSLDHTLRQQLAERLLPELFHRLQPGQVEIEEELAKFVSTIENHQRAAAWGENPLLFSLAAAVFVRTGTLPAHRAVLYQQVTDAVLETREPDPTRRRLLRRVAADLALNLYRLKGRTFTRDDIVDLLPRTRQKQGENWSTEDMATRLITSGILDVIAQETYGFRHQTFQEYLAAVGLAQQLISQEQATKEEGWEFIWNKRIYSRWTEVLQLMVGVLVHDYRKEGARLANQWLTALVGQQTEPGGDLGNLGLILAMNSLSEVSGVGTDYWEKEQGENVEKEVISFWIAALCHTTKSYQEKKRLSKALASNTNRLNDRIVKELVGQLLTALAENDAKGRDEIVQTLELFRSDIPVEPILALLNDPSAQVRRFAVDFLGDLNLNWLVHSASGRPNPDIPVEPILALLNDPGAQVRSSAAVFLANLNHHFPEEYLPIVLNINDPSLSQHFEHLRYSQWYKELVQERNGEQPTESQLVQALYSADWRVRTFVVEHSPLGICIPVDLILMDLRDKDGERRSRAVQALRGLGEDAPIELLLDVLHDEESDVQTNVVAILSRLNPDTSLELFKAALTHDNSSVRREVLEILDREEMNQRISLYNDAERPLGRWKDLFPVELFLQALRDEDEIVRSNAAKLLMHLGNRVPIEPLVAALDDESELVRRDVVIALGNIRANVPVEPLIETLYDENMDVGELAAEALVKLGWQPAEQLLLEDRSGRVTWIRATALEVLCSVDNLPIEIVQTMLHNQNAQVRAKAVELIGASGNQAPIEPLLAALKDQDTSVRLAAAIALGKQNTCVQIEPLLHAVLHDKDQQVREELARTLGEFSDQVPLEPFLTALHDEQASIRAAAADVLGELGIRTPLEPLLLALNDRHPDVRSMVVWALGQQGTRAPLERLVEALNDENVSVRSQAVWALGCLGERAPVELLFRTLYDENEQVQSLAVGALIKVADRVPVEPLLEMLHSEQRYVERAVLQVLGNLAKSLPLEPLLNKLSDEHEDIRREVLQVLESLSEQMPVEMVLVALRDKRWSVRKQALKLAAKLGERMSLGPLLEALDTTCEDHGQIAAEMLDGRLPDESLWTALNSPHWSLRAAAAHLLGKRGIRHAIPSLVTLLKDQEGENWRVAAAAALAISRLEGPVETLLTLFDERQSLAFDAEAGVSSQVCIQKPSADALYQRISFSQLYTSPALESLMKSIPVELVVAALGDSGKYVRQSALNLLRQTHPDILLSLVPEALAILQEQASGNILGSMIQGAIARCIGNLAYISSSLLEKLASLLDWPYWEVRMNAAEALGKLRRNIPDAAIRRLIELQHDQQSREVRAAAKEALAEILSLETGIEDG